MCHQMLKNGVKQIIFCRETEISRIFYVCLQQINDKKVTNTSN